MLTFLAAGKILYKVGFILYCVIYFRCPIAFCEEIDCLENCELPHINCDCEVGKRIPKNKLKFVKNQRMRVGVRQFNLTPDQIKLQKEAKGKRCKSSSSSSAPSWKKQYLLVHNREPIVAGKKGKKGTTGRNYRKKKKVLQSKVKEKEVKKIRNQIYYHQFEEDICDQQESVYSDTEKTFEIYIKEEPDPLDLVETKIDVQEFELFNDVNPSYSPEEKSIFVQVKVEDKYNENQHFK